MDLKTPETRNKYEQCINSCSYVCDYNLLPFTGKTSYLVAYILHIYFLGIQAFNFHYYLKYRAKVISKLIVGQKDKAAFF